MIKHYPINLPPYKRGFHIITEKILEEITLPQNGLLHVFIKHTSAGLSINENADPSVRVDFESIFNQIIPEGLPFLAHTMEGLDDMPAHIKASLVGSSISIPVLGGQLDLGIWQGIYLCEFRNHGGCRSITATIYS